MSRIAAEQIELATGALFSATAATGTLSSATSDAEAAVHRTRKAIKRLRTIDRLRAESLRGKRLERRKRALRSAAQALSAARDAEVLLATLEQTIAKQEQLTSRRGVMRLRALLLAQRATAEAELQGHGGGVKAALATLSWLEEDERAVQGGLRPVSADSIALTLEEIYAGGCKAMGRALRSGEIVDMHEWRKRVKDLRYAAEMLTREVERPTKQRKRPPTKGKQDKGEVRLRKLARRADTLGEALGEEHDLALLASRIRAERALFKGDRKGRKALLLAIERRRKRLRKQASKLGRELYAEKPKRFGKRVRSALS